MITVLGFICRYLSNRFSQWLNSYKQWIL